MILTQASTTLTRGPRALRLGAALLLALLPLATASARIHHNDAWARQQFAKAERMREALNGRPAGERTRREYQRVIDSYRRVYFGSPASSKADPSVVATAELMIEMGRRFDDNKILRGAVNQYRFLRKEYPGSKYRFYALFTIGEIYKDDLNDPEEARTIFEDFLHRYPRNRLADDARAAMKEIDAEADAMERAAQKAVRKQQRSFEVSGNANDAGGKGNANAAEFANPASARRNALPRVTGVRHWSTPDYTRVAIDVEQEVKFGSQRISHPDRIFFDLRDTKLASTLVGKAFDVDDGFLKKIRVAEFQPGRTRIVLEVDDLARYDAFLLPDPYRLIIDIHGKNNYAKQSRATGILKTDVGRTDVIKTDTPSVKGRPVPQTTASAESADDSSEPMSSSGDTKSDERKAQQDKDAVRFSKSEPVETDIPAEDVSADSKPDSANPASGIGVIKTTVAVKGSNHKIPKTIVEAEDRVPSTVATLKHEKLRAEGTSSSLHRKKSRSAGAAPDTADLRPETREARPPAAGDRSLIRALGLKIGKIVIDAGHGGHDTGTIGPNGLLEKDLVLDVSKRLGKLLEARLGADVAFTRRDDTFIPLETRTSIANQAQADLFVSVHANSSRDPDARGVETY